jgi:hypothetical protein
MGLLKYISRSTPDELKRPDMRTRIAVVLALALLTPLKAVPLQTPSPTGATVDFYSQIEPIFSSRCYGCHAEAYSEANLRLDSKTSASRVILPGNGNDSLLIQRVLGINGLRRMPAAGPPLPADQIEILRRWVDQGAIWPDAPKSAAAVTKHWAYVKPVKPTQPQVKNTGWIRNPIDNFVLARLEKEGLHPSPEASRETLIRRLSLDLIGLPPTPAEVDAFVNDTRADAYDRLVERLLSSPHYGERWATPWLDLARYGDSDGYEKDAQREGWAYRDWVIDAFNRNMPFDQFTIEQLAGDLLPNATREQKVATGFVRASMLNTEAGTDPEEQNWVAQLDRASTVGTTFLGSTIGCAQCHNHKYDPFTQKDFYGLVAFFNNAAFTTGRFRGGSFAEATLDLATPEQAARRDALNQQIRQLQQQIDNWPQADQLQAAWERGIVESENDWTPLIPTRLQSSAGATLTAAADGSVLASGKTPDSDTYVVEARVPLNGNITGIRLEALPDPSLPMNGPGRDYYGNFSVQSIDVEAGSSVQKLSPIAISNTLTDAPSVETNDTVIRVNLRQLWRAQVGGMEHLRRQLLLVPEKPVTADANGVIRVTIRQTSDVAQQLLGHFRLSVTTSRDAARVVAVPFALRPLVGKPNAAVRATGTAAEEEDAALGAARSPRQQLKRQWQSVAPELASLRDRIADLQKQIQALKIPTAPVLSENAQVSHPSTNLRIRGDFTNKGENVAAGVPSFLGSLPSDVPQNRLGLAKWLVSRDNPLTARVRLNQIWQSYFGRGIVETSEDFGSQGSSPSHPDLLDWLAVEFMDRGWDQKVMHRLIVTSSTYRQSSALNKELQERDPYNILLARGPRFRVEGEMVRDVVLQASGLLSEKLGGPPVMPYQPDGLWVFPFQPKDDKWVLSEGEDRHRRGIYTFVRRTARYPSLMVFDTPSREYCTARRPNTDTPLQALTALNDPAFFEAAQAMAQRILRQGGATAAAKAVFAFRLATGRRPDAIELKSLEAAFQKELDYFKRNTDEAKSIAGRPDPELAGWTMVSNALLNLDETLTKE